MGQKQSHSRAICLVTYCIQFSAVHICVRYVRKITESMSEEQQAYTIAKYLYTVVSRKKAPPPFCNLSLSTKHRGAYKHRMRQFLSRLHPPCWLSVGVGAESGVLPIARRRNAPDTSGRLINFSIEG